jgi:hypothetical protein
MKTMETADKKFTGSLQIFDDVLPAIRLEPSKGWNQGGGDPVEHE